MDTGLSSKVAVDCVMTKVNTCGNLYGPKSHIDGITNQMGSHCRLTL